MDELNRKPLANTIFHLIRDSNLQTSVRIGVYGRWGEGKTTVLQYVQTLAHANKYKVAWFNPWNAPDFIHLWSNFYVSVLEAFSAADVKKQWSLREWTAKYLPVFAKIPYMEKVIGTLPDLAIPLILSTIRSD